MTCVSFSLPSSITLWNCSSNFRREVFQNLPPPAPARPPSLLLPYMPLACRRGEKSVPLARPVKKYNNRQLLRRPNMPSEPYSSLNRRSLILAKTQSFEALMHHLSFSYPLQANRYVIQLKNLPAIMASVSPQTLSVMGLMIAEMAATKQLTADLDVVSINVATHLHH